MKSFNIEFSPWGSKEIFVLKYYNIKVQLKFGDGDGPNLCRVKKVDVSSTFIENK